MCLGEQWQLRVRSLFLHRRVHVRFLRFLYFSDYNGALLCFFCMFIATRSPQLQGRNRGVCQSNLLDSRNLVTLYSFTRSVVHAVLYE